MNSLNYSFYFNLTKNNIKILNLKFFPYAWCYPPSIHNFFPRGTVYRKKVFRKQVEV